MANIEEVLTYLKTNARARPCDIQKGISLSKRDTFRVLKLLYKRMWISKDGRRPKIYYSLSDSGHYALKQQEIAASKVTGAQVLSSNVELLQRQLKESLYKIKLLEEKVEEIKKRKNEINEERTFYYDELARRGANPHYLFFEARKNEKSK